MKPPRFDYVAPATVDEALSALADGGEPAQVLAGGQSLLAMLNLRLLEPEILIDISGLQPWKQITDAGETLVVAAAVTQAQLLDWPELATRAPLLARALPWVGHTATRNKGTICGSIAHADPSSELPLCLATLRGEVVLRSRRGCRILRADEFQIGMLSTARKADELIEAVRFPTARTGDGHGFAEFGQRHGDFALIAIAVVARANGLTIGVGGMASRPEVRDWPLLDGSALDDALNEFAWELHGSDDQHASARYRRHLLRYMGKNVIQEACACRG